MSGFDVRMAEIQRSRVIGFFATLGLSLVLITGLLVTRSNIASAAPEADDPAFRLVEAESAAPLTADFTFIQERGQAFIAGAAGRLGARSAALRELDWVSAEHAAFIQHSAAIAPPQARRVTVRRGQTFAGVLQDLGVDPSQTAQAVSALNEVFPVRGLRAGQDLTVYVHRGEAVDLAGLSFRPGLDSTITLARTVDGTFRPREIIADFDEEIVRARGAIESNLYLAALEAGATDRIIFELAQILGFKVDFRAIQYGDTFDIVFSREVNADGETVRTGDILYVNFHGRGEPLEYFRFETPDGAIGYYTAEGESAQRLLMLTPINGARLSSQFGMRFHPVLAENRMHNGTDFAAPRGTPIMAAGAGSVERANRFGSFGNFIRIRHANGYQTHYAHLQGFASGIAAGVRVQQGQIIGYVGTTGRSTGPHLHYEVLQNGRHLNPMSLDLPTGRQLTAEELDLFAQERDRILALREASPAANGLSDDTLLVADRGGAARTP